MLGWYQAIFLEQEEEVIIYFIFFFILFIYSILILQR